MGMDGQPVDTSEHWTLDSGRRKLLCCEAAGIGQSARTSTAVLACDRSSMVCVCVCVCGPPSVSSLASLGSPVSSLKGPVSIVRRRVSSCPAGTQTRTGRASLVSSCALGLEIDGHHTGLFLSFLLLLTDCRLAPARLAK